MWKWLIEKWRTWKLKRAMSRFRRTLAWFGYATEHLSDEEIIASVTKLGPLFAVFGVSAKEAAQNFKNSCRGGVG